METPSVRYPTIENISQLSIVKSSMSPTPTTLRRSSRSAATPTRQRATDAAPAAAALLALRRRRARFALIGSAVVLVVVVIVAIGIGPVAIDPLGVIDVLVRRLTGQPAQNTIADQIVWSTRLPRIGMALFAGAGLAMAGAVFQALVRNPLADPYLLGLNSGASAGVALVVLVVGASTALAVSGAALGGAVATIVLVLAVAGGSRARGPARFVLSGLAVGYALNAVASMLVFLSDSAEAARSVMFWLLGSIASVQPVVLAAVAIVVMIALCALIGTSGRLDALASGDDSALAAGLRPERDRFILLAGTAAMVGVVVSGVGGVGFVGLVVPHLARALVGGRHRILLPASALIGAALLVAADTVARTVLAPQEIPVGVVTGVIGTPFLLFLLAQRHIPSRQS